MMKKRTYFEEEDIRMAIIDANNYIKTMHDPDEYLNPINNYKGEAKQAYQDIIDAWKQKLG